eukprot:1039249_1
MAAMFLFQLILWVQLPRKLLCSKDNPSASCVSIGKSCYLNNQVQCCPAEDGTETTCKRDGSTSTDEGICVVTTLEDAMEMSDNMFDKNAEFIAIDKTRLDGDGTLTISFSRSAQLCILVQLIICALCHCMYCCIKCRKHREKRDSMDENVELDLSVNALNINRHYSDD